jgi:hypothetical protein
MFNKNIIDNKHPLTQFPNFPTFFSVWSGVYPKEKIPPTKLILKSSTANFQTPWCVCVCVCVCVCGVSAIACVCLKAELIYNVLFILYSSVRGFFSLGFETLPFRPKFPLHVNPFRAVTRSQASAARKASPFLGPCPLRDRDYGIGSNFWKFYLLEEPVSHLVKVFTLFRLERIVLVFTVWTQ